MSRSFQFGRKVYFKDTSSSVFKLLQANMFAMSLIWNLWGEFPPPNLAVEHLKVTALVSKSATASQQVSKPFEMQVLVPTPSPPQILWQRCGSQVRINSSHNLHTELVVSWYAVELLICGSPGKPLPTLRFGNAHVLYPKKTLPDTIGHDSVLSCSRDMDEIHYSEFENPNFDAKAPGLRVSEHLSHWSVCFVVPDRRKTKIPLKEWEQFLYLRGHLAWRYHNQFKLCKQGYIYIHIMYICNIYHE